MVLNDLSSVRGVKDTNYADLYDNKIVETIESKMKEIIENDDR